MRNERGLRKRTIALQRKASANSNESQAVIRTIFPRKLYNADVSEDIARKIFRFAGAPASRFVDFFRPRMQPAIPLKLRNPIGFPLWLASRASNARLEGLQSGPTICQFICDLARYLPRIKRDENAEKNASGDRSESCGVARMNLAVSFPLLSRIFHATEIDD